MIKLITKAVKSCQWYENIIIKINYNYIQLLMFVIKGSLDLTSISIRE